MIQLQFLNKILDSQDFSIVTLNNINDSYFPAYKKEFNYIKDHFNTYGNVPDKTSFINEFPHFDIIKVSESNNYLVNELYKEKKTKYLTTAFNEMRDLILKDDIDKAEATLNKIINETPQFTQIKSVDITSNIEDRYETYLDKCNDYTKYYIKTGYPELDKLVGGWDRHEDLVTIVARPGVGKCLEKGTKVLMADGTTKKVEDIKIGDKVQSLNRVNTVIDLHNGKSKGYKIIPNIGDPFTVSENHILTLMYNELFLDKNKKTSTTNNNYKLVDIMIEDYLKLNNNTKRRYSLYKPSIDYPTKTQLIPPYILGLWLGDGSKSSIDLTSIKNPIKDKNNLRKMFKQYNLLDNKHIPLDYLTGDRNQRLELLAGLLDTDGYLHVNKNRSNNNINYIYEITQKDKNLIDQISQLARGLGIKVSNIKEKYNKIYKTFSYKITLSGQNIKYIPNRLSRKKVPQTYNVSRYLPLTKFKIEEIPEIEYYGFMCDGDSRYLLWDNTITHNTYTLLKSAVAAAEQGLNVGIYEGEMSLTKVSYRIDTLISHISNGQLIHGNYNAQQEYKNYLDNLKDKIKGTIKILTPNMIGGPAGVSALRAFVERDNLDVLFVDQHSLLEDDRGAKNPVEKASNISKDLKNLQVMKQIPIIAVSQQNRNSTSENGVGTEHVAQSDRISQDSTIILFLEKKDDLLTMHLVKSRDTGSGNELKYKVNYDKGIYDYIPVEEESDDEDQTKEQEYEDIKNSYEVTNNFNGETLF